MELPRWRSHKVVEAARIIAVDRDAPSSTSEADPPFTLTLEHENARFEEKVPRIWIEKHGPEVGSMVGGFFVRYMDGYLSWSPFDAFEAGYELIE